MKKLLSYILMLSLCIVACKKPKANDEQNNNNNNKSNNENKNVPKGTLLFHLHTYIDENEVDLYNANYTNDDARVVSLSLAQLYISEIELVKLDGSIYTIPYKKILKVLEEETFSAGDVPVGNYKGLRFKVGLNSATNALNPGASADSNTLKRTEMWMNNTAQPDGYAFMNVQGSIDTSSDLSGAMIPFVYKIGGNANFKQVIMPEQNFSIMEGMAEYAHIKVNYNKLFHGIKLNDINNLSVQNLSDNSGALAQKIVANIPNMFIYE
ncbi:MAG: MbnP family protein [Flavobacteriales bacterium]